MGIYIIFFTQTPFLELVPQRKREKAKRDKGVRVKKERRRVLQITYFQPIKHTEIESKYVWKFQIPQQYSEKAKHQYQNIKAKFLYFIFMLQL